MNKHTEIVIEKTLKYGADISLNFVSFGIILLDITADFLSMMPQGVAWLIGLSVAFLNTARGIQALKNKDKK